MTLRTGGPGVGVVTLACFIAMIACPNPGWAGDVDTSPDPKLYMDRSGLNEMIVQNISYGYLIGVMTGAVISGDNTEDEAARVFGGALFGAAAGVGLPLLFTMNKPVLSGDVVFTTWAGRIGLQNGFIIPALFLDWDDIDSLGDVRVPLCISIAVSLGAYTTAWLLADKVKPSPGQASAMGSGFLWGWALASLSVQTINPDLEDDTDYKIMLGSMLAVADIGLTLAAIFFADGNISRSRIIWTDIGGIVGTGAGLGLGFLIAGDEEQVATGLGIVGMLGGLTLGWILSAGTEDWKKDAPVNASGSLVTVRDGDWTVGVPIPRLEPAIGSDGQVESRSLRFSAGLLDMTW